MMRLGNYMLSSWLLALLVVLGGAVPGSSSGSVEFASVSHHHHHHGDTEAGHRHPIEPNPEQALSAHRSNVRFCAIIDQTQMAPMFGVFRLVPENRRTPGGPHLLRRRNSSYDQGVGLLLHDQRPLA